VIGRARELLAELVDVARAARALPHVIERSRDLELRILALERRADALADHVSDLATAGADTIAMVSELYIGPRGADAEVPDA
jgi:hypothetical protein